MAKKLQGDLSVYNSLDPDSILKPGSMTFFYIPQSNSLYAEPYPTAHWNMLEDDDDLFFDVYPELKRAKVSPKQRISLSSRGQALEKSQALLGRIGAAGDAICIVFWSDPTPELFGRFLSKLFDKFAQFRAVQDKVIVVGPGQGAKMLTDLVGGKPAKRAVTLPRKKKVNPLPTPTRTYSDEEIAMYRQMYTMTGDAKKVAMKQLGVGGSGGEHPWKAALRQTGLPGGDPGQKWWTPTSEGFGFRDWIEYQDAFS